MQIDDAMLSKAKKSIEDVTGWGNSDEWTNQDFIALSEKIFQQTKVSISHVTLKRIWGKVKYDSLPNTHTLNTLVQFLGYESWRDFKAKNNTEDVQPEPAEVQKESSPVHKRVKTVAILSGLVVLCFCFLFFYSKESNIDADDYSFSSKKVVSQGLPNSVIFDYDATKAPGDSVIIQQSWDKRLQTKVSKDKHQHTSIYYYPDFYKAKLIVEGQIVKEHNLMITSNGWLTVVATSPVPVYFKKEESIANGKIHLPLERIKEQNINMQPEPPTVVYSNVHDFGDIYTDDFVFETRLKNDYAEGASVCQKTNIYLLCEGTAIGVPLCAKGCVSDIDLLFTAHFWSGKQKDLSAFGVDFTNYVDVRVESSKGGAKIFFNQKLIHEIPDGVIKAKIIGIDYTFLGTGSVEYARLSNMKGIIFEDEFESW